MQEHERNRLIKLRSALLFAASDMQQAEAAANALEVETENAHLARALETAIVVCYCRAFTLSSLKRLEAEDYVASTDRELHDWLMDQRDKVYAHTDKAGGRKAEVRVYTWTEIGSTPEGAVDYAFSGGSTEEWEPFPRELISPLIEFVQRQNRVFTRHAYRTHLILQGVPM